MLLFLKILFLILKMIQSITHIPYSHTQIHTQFNGSYHRVSFFIYIFAQPVNCVNKIIKQSCVCVLCAPQKPKGGGDGIHNVDVFVVLNMHTRSMCFLSYCLLPDITERCSLTPLSFFCCCSIVV